LECGHHGECAQQHAGAFAHIAHVNLVGQIARHDDRDGSGQCQRKAEIVDHDDAENRHILVGRKIVRQDGQGPKAQDRHQPRACRHQCCMHEGAQRAEYVVAPGKIAQ
jgi:hypothetical protein